MQPGVWIWYDGGIFSPSYSQKKDIFAYFLFPVVYLEPGHLKLNMKYKWKRIVSQQGNIFLIHFEFLLS